MKEGAEEFFTWCDHKDVYCEITYMPACGELEIKMSIIGEGDFYQKRSGTFEQFLANAKKHYKRNTDAKNGSNKEKIIDREFNGYYHDVEMNTKTYLWIRELEKENEILKSALQKIDEPMKYHHWEEDPYTRSGCFQFVAHEALKSVTKNTTEK